MSRRSISKGHRALIALILAVLIAAPVVSFAVTDKLPEIPEDGFAIVQRGPLRVLLTDSGVVESGNNVTLASRCEWSTRIINMVPEGTWVKKGDVVVELDASDIQKRFDDRQIRVVNAESLLKQAEEALEMQKLTNESRLADAQLNARLNTLMRDGYLDAEYPQQLHELESTVALAEEALTRAEKSYEFVSEMVQLGYRTRSDKEVERIKLLKAKQELATANDKLNVLTTFTYPRRVIQLKASCEESVRELDRVQSTARASILSRTVTLRARERSYEIYRAYQERLQRNIDACTIRAPRTGQVVYNYVSRSRSLKLEEGSSVHYLQTLAKMPDRNQMQVQMRIHESQVNMISEGQPAVVKLDSNSNRTYQGHVAEVSTVPLSGQYPNYDLREYRVVVAIDGLEPGSNEIAPECTAKVDIVAADRQNALHVPIQSVTEVAGHHLAFVRNGDFVEHREIKIGVTNDEQIEILEGLDEGEQVVLKPRITCASLIQRLESSYLAMKPKGWYQWATTWVTDDQEQSAS